MLRTQRSRNRTYWSVRDRIAAISSKQLARAPAPGQFGGEHNPCALPLAGTLGQVRAQVPREGGALPTSATAMRQEYLETGNYPRTGDRPKCVIDSNRLERLRSHVLGCSLATLGEGVS